MVLATHAAFTVVSQLLPIAQQSTRRLFRSLDVVGFSPLERASPGISACRWCGRGCSRARDDAWGRW
jgi:hypothetical protein